MTFFLLQVVFSAFRGNEELYQGVLVTVFIVAGLILMSCIVSAMTLRLNRGIFICPADDAWKMKYLSLEVAINIGLDLLMMGFLVKLAIGRFFVPENRILCAVQMILEIFTFLNTSLRIEVAEGSARKVDENGYLIQSKAEVMIKIYWMCLLILEWLFFGLCVAGFSYGKCVCSGNLGNFAFGKSVSCLEICQTVFAGNPLLRGYLLPETTGGNCAV